MLYQQVKRCLDILKEYPAIEKYIKEFNGKEGFMYTIETDDYKINLQQKMNELLDDGTHSIASWGCMLRLIQGILNGTLLYEIFLGKLEEEKLHAMMYI